MQMALKSDIARRGYEVAWIDPALHHATAVVRIADFERTRRFAHMGAAIAWSRRKLFHGAVAGDFVEMHAVNSYTQADGSIRDDHFDVVVEISLKGFRRADNSRHYNGHNALWIGKSEKRCVL